MKNLINSKINFSVVTEDSLLQAHTLEASQAGTEQVLMTMPSNLYVLQEPERASVGDVLMAERSGEDLLLAFRAQESARPVLKFDQFFTHNGRLHILKQDGELLRAVVSDGNPQQGLVEFDLQTPSAAEQQAIEPVLGLLLPTVDNTPDDNVDMLFVSPVGDAAAPVQLATLNITPLSIEPPQITHAIDQIGARQGSLTSGSVTDDRYATIEGTGTPGAYLEILDNGEVIGEVQVDSDGRWRFDPDQAFEEAGHILTARVQGSGDMSASFVLVVDTIAPSRAFIDSISDDRNGSQIIERNGHTSDNTPMFKGRAEPFSVVVLYSGKTLMGTSFTDAAGNWEFSSLFIMPDGEYTISATALDFSGNAGLSSTSYKITIDTLPPATPTIEQAIDDVGMVQGILHAGAVTDDTCPTLIGKAEPGTVVSIYDHGQKLGTVRADENGNWSFTPTEALSKGEHNFTAQAQDLAGNLSEPSQPWGLVIDNSTPEKPGSEGSRTQISEGIDDHGPVQGPIEQGGVTDDTTPTFNGTGEPGDTIIIRDGEEEIGRVDVGSDGNWSFTPEEPLADGEHAISVIVQNPAGNQSEPSDPWIVTVDTQAPDAPTIGRVYDDVGAVIGELVSGAVTDDTKPTLTGQAEAGAIVSIFDGEEKLGEVQADENGNWSFTPEQALSEGEHSFTVRAQDAAGNLSEPSQPWEVVIDTTAPVKPGSEGSNTDISEVIDDHGPIQGPIEQGGVTDDTTPTFNGTGEPGETIIIRDGEEEIGRADVDSEGNWSFTPEEPLAEGEHEISVIVQDEAGNQSEPSDPWIVTIDTQAPDAPSIDLAIDDEGFVQGPLQSGAMTDDRTPTLSGKAEANVEVFVYDNDILLGTTHADASGNWSFTPEAELNDGEHRFTTAARDQSGNMSSQSGTFFELTVASSTATANIGDVRDNAGSIQGSIDRGQYTDDTTPTLTGQGKPGSTVRIYDNGVLLGSVQAGTSGEWTFTPSAPLSEGEHRFTATGEDEVGEGKPSAPYMVIIDSTPPTQVATVTAMGKDSGVDNSDWLTSDGSAGRLMQGTLSATLAPHEKLQISTDGGLTWVDAFVDDTQWSAQDTNAHDKDWTILSRTVDSNGLVGELSAQDVTLDSLAPKPPVSISKDGETVTVVFDKSNVEIGDRISLVNGDERQDYILTEQDIAAGRVTITSSITVSDDMLIGIVDKANNASDYMRSTGALQDFSNCGNESIGYFNPKKTLENLTIEYSSGTTYLTTDPLDGRHALRVNFGTQANIVLNEPATEITISIRWANFDPDQRQVGTIRVYDPTQHATKYFSVDRSTDYQEFTFSLPSGGTLSSFVIFGDAEGVFIDRVEAKVVELLPPNDIQMIVENGGMYGGEDDTIFLMETDTLPDGAIVSGGAGVDQLKLSNAGQTLDLSTSKAKVSSVEVFDITGTGDNTLKLSLGDVLENGGKNLFLADDNVQMMIKGDVGDKVILDDLLPNGTDPGDWAAVGTVTVAGVAYETYQHSALHAELLVQQGVTVDLV